MKYFLIRLLLINLISIISTQINIIEVSPVTLSKGVASFVVFTIKIEGAHEFVPSLIKAQINNENYIQPCSGVTLEGSKIRCPVNIATAGKWKILYNTTASSSAIIVEDVKINQITPTTTLQTVLNQTITLTFNRLPLPTTINYENAEQKSDQAKQVDCVDNELRLEKTCSINLTVFTDPFALYFFLNDQTLAEIKSIQILSTEFKLESITPPQINQNITQQLISLTFTTEIPTNSIEKAIYFDKANAVCSINKLILNCKVLLRTPGTIPIYIGGVNSNKTIIVSKVDEDILFQDLDLDANLINLSFLTLIILFLIY